MCEGVFREVKLRCPHRIWVVPFYGMRTQTEGKKEQADRTPAFISLYFLRAEAISPAANTAPIVVTVPSHCEPKQTCLPLHCFLGICQSKVAKFIAGESCLLDKQLTELPPFVTNPTSPHTTLHTNCLHQACSCSSRPLIHIKLLQFLLTRFQSTLKISWPNSAHHLALILFVKSSIYILTREDYLLFNILFIHEYGIYLH